MVPKLACYDILGAVSFLKPQPNLFLWRFSFHIINKCSTCAPKEALDIFHNFYTISRLLWKRQNICQGQWSQTLIQSRWVLPPGINTVFLQHLQPLFKLETRNSGFLCITCRSRRRNSNFYVFGRRAPPEPAGSITFVVGVAWRRHLDWGVLGQPAKPCQPFKFKRCSWPWCWSYKCQKYQRQRIVFNDRRTSWHRRYPRW